MLACNNNTVLIFGPDLDFCARSKFEKLQQTNESS